MTTGALGGMGVGLFFRMVYQQELKISVGCRQLTMPCFPTCLPSSLLQIEDGSDPRSFVEQDDNAEGEGHEPSVAYTVEDMLSFLTAMMGQRPSLSRPTRQPSSGQERLRLLHQEEEQVLQLPGQFPRSNSLPFLSNPNTSLSSQRRAQTSHPRARSENMVNEDVEMIDATLETSDPGTQTTIAR